MGSFSMLRDSGRVGASEKAVVGALNGFSETEVVHYIPWDYMGRLPAYDEHSALRATVSTDFSPFVLPKAPKFQKYLEQACLQRRRKLEVKKPRDANVPFSQTAWVGDAIQQVPWKIWEIYLDGSLFGTYFLGAEERDRNGKKNYFRRYEGRVLGKFNQGVADLNDENRTVYGDYYKGYSHIPTDTFHLAFGYRELYPGQGCRTFPVFKRFDGHTDIPFPN